MTQAKTQATQVITEGFVLKRNDGVYVAHLNEKGAQAMTPNGDGTFRVAATTSELTKAHRFSNAFILAGIHSVMSDKEAWSIVPVRLTLAEVREEVAA
jgi:hypothetical protein